MAGRSRPFWSRTGTTSTTPAVIALPGDWKVLQVFVDELSLAGVGSTYAAPAVDAVNGITTIFSTGTPTAGTFVARVRPFEDDILTTTALTYDESAADVKSALVATTAFATGDITAAGGALPTSITLTWTGVYAGVVPYLDIVSSVTGGVILSRTTTQPAGNGGYAYLQVGDNDPWTADGRGESTRYLYVATVASTGNYYVTAYR